jgi:Uma2 family endonuclease
MILARERSTSSRTPAPRPFRWTADDFMRADQAGAFGEKRMELLAGEVFEKLGQNVLHRVCVSLVSRALRQVFGEANHTIREQATFPLTIDSVPEPDVTALLREPRTFLNQVETIADVALFVEVVDSRRDTAYRKRKIYAQAGVVEYWILDVNKKQLEVHRDPSDKGYESVVTLGMGDSVTPLLAASGPVLVAELLP